MAAVILLGAGASHGSADVIPYRPPLGPRLFEDFEKSGALEFNIPKHIRELFQTDFEEGMGEYYRHTNYSVAAFQRQLARYFAQFQPGPNNVYIKLIKTLGVNSAVY